MTRSERELIIQRYLSGEMSSAEEGDFFVQVALDRELRHDLQAQQTIESAFRKDREAERTGHTALRTRVATMLAAGPPPPRPSVPEESPVEAVGGAPSAAEPLPPSPALPDAGGRRGGSIAGWSALVVCAVAVVLVLLLADPFGSNPPSSPAPSPVPGGGSLSTPTQRKELPGDVIPPDAPSRDVERPSSPTVTIPTAPRRSPAQERSSANPPRDDVRVRERSARNPAVTPAHEAAEEEGSARNQAPDRMKVGVRVKIKPQQ